MGKSAVIIGGGDFPKKEYPLYVLSQADYVVCCDGAVRRYLKYTKERLGSETPPTAIVGDLDSIPRSLREKYSDIIIQVIDQEHNDQTKAYNYVTENFKDVTDIYFLAATGKREDHTIGNISLLMEYARERDLDAAGTRLMMISDYSVIFPITDSTDLDCGTGRKVSIISPDNSLRIKSKGLQYPTDNVVFDNWWKATLNVAVQDTVRLEFSHPSTAIVILD